MHRNSERCSFSSHDFSGNGVLVPDPMLELHQCGLPEYLALMLFEPVVIRFLIDSGRATSPRYARELIAEADPEAWRALEEVVMTYPILVAAGEKVDQRRMLSFRPLLRRGDAIGIHPLVGKLWGIEFNGDEAAVHTIFSIKSRFEATTLMKPGAQLFSRADGMLFDVFSKDIILGCYCLTRPDHRPLQDTGLPAFSDIDGMEYAVSMGKIDWWTSIRYRNPDHGTDTLYGDHAERWLQTTVGRVRFNSIFPRGLGFINHPVERKRLHEIFKDCARIFSKQEVVEVLEQLVSISIDAATRAAPSPGLFDLLIPEGKPTAVKEGIKITKKTRKLFERGVICHNEMTNKVLEIWTSTTARIGQEQDSQLERESEETISQLAKSGVVVISPNLQRICAMPGPVAGPGGHYFSLPITSGLREGLSTHEFLMSAGSARRKAVHLLEEHRRGEKWLDRLIGSARDLFITMEDCGTSNSVNATAIWKHLAGDLPRLYGRVCTADIVDTDTGEILIEANHPIHRNAARRLELFKKAVEVRSPITCEAPRGCCQRCFGLDPVSDQFPAIGAAVGLRVAQCLASKAEEIFGIKYVRVSSRRSVYVPPFSRLEEFFEAREPGNRADLATIEGTIRIGGHFNRKRQIMIFNENLNHEIECRVSPDRDLLVRDGDVVQAGDKLTWGEKDFRDMLEILGYQGLRAYWVEEVQDFYRIRGFELPDSYFEVMLNRMLQFVKIQRVGDSNFKEGEIVKKEDFGETNRSIGKGQPALASPLLMGISQLNKLKSK